MELRIKEAIKEKGYTIKAVAESIGKSQQTLHGIIEKGNPTISTLQSIAEAIGVPISQLYSESKRANLTALIYYKGEYYKADSLSELEEIVEKIAPPQERQG